MKEPVRLVVLVALGALLVAATTWLARIERPAARPAVAPEGDAADGAPEVAPGKVELLAAPAVTEAERVPPQAPGADAAPAPGEEARRSPAALARRLRVLLPERYGALTEAELLALEELDLHGAAVDASDLAALAALPALRRLSLRGTPVTEDALAVLRGLPLTWLDLRDTRVAGGAFGALPASTLEALHLTGTDVSEADLVRLPAMPRLTTLKLNFLALSDAAIESLAIYPRLTHVELDQTTLTDAGLRRLLELHPGLRRVEARGTGVTAEGVAALRGAYPDCEVVHEQPELAALRLRGR